MLDIKNRLRQCTHLYILQTHAAAAPIIKSCDHNHTHTLLKWIYHHQNSAVVVAAGLYYL